MSKVKTHTKLYADKAQACEDAAALAGEWSRQIATGHYEDRGDGWTYEVKRHDEARWYIELRDEDGNFIALWGDPLFDGLL